MVLAIDVGNTNIVLGGFAGEELRFISRMSTDRHKMPDEYAILLKQVLALYGFAPEPVSYTHLKVTINVAGKYPDGAKLNFYYFNESTKKFELIAKDIEVVNGKVVIPLTHCSEYILTDTPIAGATVAPSTPSTAKPTPSTPSTGSAANPQTGDSNPIGLLALMVALLTGSLAVFKKKVIDVK